MKRIKCEHLFRILSLAIQDGAGSSCLMPGSRLFILPSYATRRRDRWPDSLASHHRSSHKSYLELFKQSQKYIHRPVLHRCNRKINKFVLVWTHPLVWQQTPSSPACTTHWWPLSSPACTTHHTLVATFPTFLAWNAVWQVWQVWQVWPVSHRSLPPAGSAGPITHFTQ